MDRPPARVLAVLARDAPVGVVFRRGPSDWTALARWNLDTDEVTLGDWFRGRLYARRCDLTPNGELLVYFAANFGSTRQPGFAYGYAWTAVSQPPSLRPVTRWTKDDCWAGGGLFVNHQELVLNEADGVATPGVPEGLRVRFDPDARGEDEPVYGRRLERDGFKLIQPLDADYQDGAFVTAQPELRHKTCSGAVLELSRSLEGFSDVHRYAYAHPDGARVALSDLEWADFDHRGRIVGASNGSLVASAVQPIPGFSVIADLNEWNPPAST